MDDLLVKIGQINNSATASYAPVLESVLTTCQEMLKDRGFTVIYDYRTIGDITFKMQESDVILYGEKMNERGVVLFFHNEERVGVKQLRQWNEAYDKNIIVVSLEGPTAFTKREADKDYLNFQFFLFKNLCVNITKHSLVPKHEKIQKTNDNFLKNTIKSANELPKLYTNDAVCQYYDFKPGEIIRITRTVGYPEPVYYYRLVTNPPQS
jgi:DNA-directed RNA polymerase subunit H (RpoH/RPB5)